MKSPWPFHAREDAELEALQTDVMRFVAILGLCLAAIFSLVHSAAQEQQAGNRQATVEPAPTRVKKVKAADAGPQAEADAGLPPATPATPAKVPPASEQGFSLEFASADALISLVAQNRVALYLRQEDTFWRLGTDGTFQPSPAPERIYRMAAGTVPAAYRNAVPGRPARQTAIWGVTLPASITAQLDRHTGAAEGGNLVIQADGTVRLDGSAQP